MHAIIVKLSEMPSHVCLVSTPRTSSVRPKPRSKFKKHFIHSRVNSIVSYERHAVVSENRLLEDARWHSNGGKAKQAERSSLAPSVPATGWLYTVAG